MKIADKLKSIIERLPDLSPYQVDTIDKIINQLAGKTNFWRHEQSDIINDHVLRDFGDALRVHHVFSAEALSKDRFEFALERVLNGCSIPACRAPRGNPGHDINIRGVPFSLKTQANKSIKIKIVHISKYMELGKGDWTNDPEELVGLRQRFFDHMSKYDRIFTLRRLKDPNDEFYELVEIYKSLLEEASTGELKMFTESRQNPKPGSCRVLDHKSKLKFELYFDGGTERKLQIRNLNKDFCMVHATWRFPRREADAELVFEED